MSLEDQTKTLIDLLRPSLGVARSRVLAPSLLAKFGSLPEVLVAPAARLSEVPGIGHRVAKSLGAAHEAAKLLARMRIDNNSPVLSSWGSLIDYCHVTMAYESVEQLRILFLDKKNRLIADEVQQTGTVDHTPVYPREVIKRALDLTATALILVHNHPSGEPTPSSSDLKMTKEIDDVARALGITLFDHLIIGKSGHVSMKAIFGPRFEATVATTKDARDGK
ncbi:MAG TPA: DNA repair protein RadC [Devosia sp.]|nr:DNA repair protein RadC [Devosia sp.]